MISPLATTAKKVIEAAWQNGPAHDLASQAAFALDSAQLLQSPEVAAQMCAAALDEGVDTEARPPHVGRGEAARFCLARQGTVAQRLGDPAAKPVVICPGDAEERNPGYATVPTEAEQLRARLGEAVAAVAQLERVRVEREKVVNALRAQVAELEAEAATQRRTGYQVAIRVMRQEKLPMSVELLEAQLELEALDVPEPPKRPAGAYPPAMPWAALMDDEDLHDFLDELAASAITHASNATALAEVEVTCGRWRVIAEAQHAHNTAPGPDRSGKPDGVTRLIVPMQTVRDDDTAEAGGTS